MLPQAAISSFVLYHRIYMSALWPFLLGSLSMTKNVAHRYESWLLPPLNFYLIAN